MLRRTLFESLLISLFIGAVLLFIPRPQAAAEPAPPTVTVTIGSPSPAAGLIGTKFTAALSAAVDGQPDLGEECTLTGPTWSWAVDLVERADSASGPWTAVTGEDVKIDPPNATTASARLLATFSTTGFWRVSVAATAAWGSPDCAAPEPVVGKKAVQMQVVKLQLKQVSYEGPGYQPIYKNFNDTYENDGSEPYAAPHFIVEPATVHPICFHWASSPGMTAVFNVVPPLANGNFAAKFKASAVIPGKGEPLNYLKSASVSGASVSVSFTTTDKLVHEVLDSVLQTKFEVSADPGDSYSACGQSVNQILIVVGAAARPSSELPIVGSNNPTLKRLRWVVSTARGATTEKEAVDFLWNRSIGTNFNGKETGIVDGRRPIWLFLDPNGNAPAVECRGQAIMQAAAVAMLGIQPLGQVVYVYPFEATRRNGKVIQRNAGERAVRDPVRRVVKSGLTFVKPHTGREREIHGLEPNNIPRYTEFLGYYSGRREDPANWLWNDFEACFKFNGEYYAGGVINQTFTTPVQVLEAVALESRWVYLVRGGARKACNVGHVPDTDWQKPLPYNNPQ